MAHSTDRECHEPQQLGRGHSLVHRPLVRRPVVASFTASVLKLQCHLQTTRAVSTCMLAWKACMRSPGWPAAHPSACSLPHVALRRLARTPPCPACAPHGTLARLQFESAGMQAHALSAMRISIRWINSTHFVGNRGSAGLLLLCRLGVRGRLILVRLTLLHAGSAR